MMGELRTALKDIDSALELNLRFADAFNNRGNVRHINGELKALHLTIARAVRQVRPGRSNKRRLAGRRQFLRKAPPVTTHLGLVVIEERCPVVVAQ